jgi:hypothetical protein
MPSTNLNGSLKRKRGEAGKTDFPHATEQTVPSGIIATGMSTMIYQRPQKRRKPNGSQSGKVVSHNINLDCLFVILSFLYPAQLLEMRSKIALYFQILRDYPMLWKYSRHYHYGPDMPEPPSGVTEFQFAHLRHGRGCMSCGAPNTRKTYWAFLRRICQLCLTSKIIRHCEAVALLKGIDDHDLSFLCDGLHTGILDSWGNFIGVGLASKHPRKTVYLRSDVLDVLAEYNREYRKRDLNFNKTPSWTAEWLAAKTEKVEERRVFAIKMEKWERIQRLCKISDYSGRKSRRRDFYREMASQLTPPINVEELEACPSYRRAVSIPKEPSNTSWSQLKPKIIKEAAVNVETATEKLLSGAPRASMLGIYMPTSSLAAQVYYRQID